MTGSPLELSDAVGARVVDPDVSTPRPTRPVRWLLSPAATAAAVTGIALLAVGALTGRVEVIGLAAPLLLNTVWCWLHRPTGFGTVDLTGRAENPRGELGGVLHWVAAAGAEQLRFRVSAPGHRPSELLLAAPRAAGAGDAPGERSAEVAIRTVRTGRRPVFTVQYAEVGPSEVLRHAARSHGPSSITVLPRNTELGQVPLPFRLQGLTGPHSGRRTGDGGDLRDVDLFAPGDRLRRIDWRVTARRAGRLPGRPEAVSELYVRRTYATADAAVMLVLDSRDEVGPDISTWGDSSLIGERDATSLDHARNAALTFAKRYLDAGDRVGLEDLGRLRRPMPPSAGRRQLQRLRQRIALSEPEGEARRRTRVPRLPSGALIIVFSTFLDDDPARFAALWRRAGHRVIAVDVLPALRLTGVTDRLRVAHRIVAMERQDRLTDLTQSGVEVVRWVDVGDRSLVADLTALARTRGHR